MKATYSIGIISSKILEIRAKKVILDRDLAILYKVSTKVLNQAVKRNIRRFPEDFMFRLSKDEKNEVVTICDHLRSLKFSNKLPYAFTEQGIAMLSSILNSERAIHVNILIMRAFVKLRELVFNNKELASKIAVLEQKYARHDEKIMAIFEAIKELLQPSVTLKPKIGFHP